MTTALRDAIDQTALGWVKPEIDETLRQTRIDLETFADAPDDASPMNSCITGLHQVSGTLQMLELQAPALVAGEMEQVAVALLGGAVQQRDEALAVLMRGMVQLPDYLERLQGGHRDIPIVLLPLINELRAARGAEAMAQEDLPALVVAPTEAELEHARGSLAGRNRALLDTVSAAIKEDLLRVKDALDLFLRGTRENVGDLTPQAEALDRIGDTLGMIGLDAARATVHEQRQIVQDIASGARPSSESDLIEVAGALITIEHSLDDQVADLGGAGAGNADEDQLAQESRKVMGVLSRAAAANFSDVRGAFVAFIETNWDHSALKKVPDMLTEVSGAMRILELPEPAGYLDALRAYAERELIARKRVPNGVQLDTLADALSGMEYFLESLRDPRDTRTDLLGKVRTSLEALSYWPIPEAEDLPEAGTAAETAEQTEEPVSETPAVPSTDAPVEAETEAAAPEAADVATVALAQGGSGIDAGFITAGEEIDDEIREIFIEEFQEELGNLEQLLPPWRLQPDDIELLRPIRRVFHTLKGSGRLVGAKVLGEFSWHVENMLNRVLDGTRPASYAVVAYIGEVNGVLPKLHAALRGEPGFDVDIPTFEAVADRLAAGEDVMLQAAAAAAETAPEAATEPVVEEPVSAEADTAAAPAETVAVAVDPVLLEILGSEVGGHLETIDAWLAEARAGDARPTDALVRAIHTLNGAFAMTEVPSVTEFTAPAEGYVRRLIAAQAAPDADGIAAIGEMADAVRASTAALQETPDRVPLFATLGERMSALRDALPEPSVPFIDQAAAEAQREAEEQAAAEEAARQEVERAAAEQAEAERIAAEQAAAEEAARQEAERAAAEQAEAERAAAEQAAAEEAAAEEAARQEAERTAAEQAEAERAATEQAEAERLAAEQAEAERAAAEEAERLEAERVAAEQAEAERLAAEQAEAERAAAEEAERLEAERVAAEQAEAERLAAEQAEAERAAAEEAARLEAERQEVERIAAARAEAERAEAERLASERREAQRREAERRAAEAAAVAKAREDAALASLLATATAAEDPDAPLDTSDLDVELIDIFVEEGNDLLDHSDGLLAQLRDAPDDNELIVGLQRDLHTFKGGARMAGMMPVGELGHAMESLLEAVAVQRAELGGDGVRLLERGFDRLRDMVTRVAARRAVGMPAMLIEEIVARSENRAYEAPAAAESAQKPEAVEPAAEAAETAEPAGEAASTTGDQTETATEAAEQASEGLPPSKDVQVPAKVAALKPLSAPINEHAFAGDDDASVRAPQEQVRIRADLLDRLVNYAGEVAIYRARLEQQLAAFRATAQEMERTNIRLRDQLRRLDSETEAQIMARYQRQNDAGDESFDPLELDRFSTLQQLSRGLAESAADLQSLHDSMDDLTRQYETLLTQQSRVSSDLQEGLMRTRMLPLDSLLPRLRRVVRQAAGETGKQAVLKVDGAQGELDRSVLERMTAPLEHMLRNSVAHGLEAPDRRAQAGKSLEGAIRIAVRNEGSEVVLEVGDDGAGLDRDAIRRRATERGLIQPDAVLTDAELDRMIFEPGFSTAESVSRLAGRGVGMDVVASEVRQLGGSIEIHSKRGEGTNFVLRLPQTLAVTQAVFVKIGDTEYAVPIASVRGVGRIPREDLAKPDAVYRYGGEDYALHDLGALVGAPTAKAEGQIQMPLLLIGSGDLRAAVAIDQVVGSREIVVKDGGPQLASLPGVFGATIMGDGRVVVILDIAPMVRRYATMAHAEVPVEAVPAEEQRRVPLVMVVDDSVTMRKVSGRVLERHGFEVATAKDGLDALEHLVDLVPDLMLLDIEMPRMDGYELATAMKGDPRLRNVPIIMITSRTGDKHRQRAIDIGVERYLGKPYQEAELMRNVFELLKLERVGDGSLQ
ncbi:Hpt domain-containing protein [Thermomonas sp.]|uniref:Hpt domain-containing protein n=1 Tax=Thermomonas sp. TaxID=1971895 RepID=UPI00260B255A|nr:Hpt domain-containing protein [Thermomonas sp.]